MEKLGLMMANRARLVALLTAICAAAALRLVPHPPNFAPIAAMALFSGACMPRRALGFVAPFGALIVSDLALGGVYPGISIVYLSFGLTVLIGWLVAARWTVLRIGSAAVASSVLFFILTNLGTWLFSGIYPLTGAGLAACYAAAIPFFRNSLAGDLFYTGLLFGGLAMAQRLVPAIRAGQREPLPA